MTKYRWIKGNNMFTDDWDYLDSNKRLLAFVRPDYSKFRIVLVEHGWFPQGLYKTAAEAKAVAMALVAMTRRENDM